jgi:type IV secretion system protein VirD4
MNGNLRAAGFAAVRMAHKYPRRPGSVGAGALGLGGLSEWVGWTDPAALLLPGGAAVTVGVTGYWWLRYVARPQTTRGMIARRAELDQRTGGVASWLDVAESAGVQALRARATILRPSLASLSRRERRKLAPTQLGVEVVRVGWGLPGQRIWSSCEDATLRIGGPRTGKTLSLACHGLDAPGALITTSTRLDLAEMLHEARRRRGAVHFFNPAGLGGLASSVRWRVLSGCEDFATAQRRATDLVPESQGEAARWDAQARRILALFLHAAAIAGMGMRDVVRWTADPSDRSLNEIVTALSSVEVGGRDRADAVRQFWATNDRTRTSITTTMATPLAWMGDDRARALGDADRDDPDLIDIRTLIARGETLHLIGHEDHTSLSPLIAALTAEIAYAARSLASARLGGRLDPPVTMLLDEAALVCPVPLDRWTADMGGRGVTIHICAQSLSQLRQRWGDDGAGTILANVAAFLVFGGSPAAADLAAISSLTGEHRMRVVGADHDGVDGRRDGERRGEYRWRPVMDIADIRALKSGQVLLLRRGLHAVVGWAPKVTDRRGWKPVSLLGDVTALNPLDALDPVEPVELPRQVARVDGVPAVDLDAARDALARHRRRRETTAAELFDQIHHADAPAGPDTAADPAGGPAPDTAPDGIDLPTDLPTHRQNDRQDGRPDGRPTRRGDGDAA